MIELIPQVTNIETALDNHGSLFNLERILGESLAVYKQRLLDIHVNKANSTYKGLTNGVTRELGLFQEFIFNISPKVLYQNSLSAITVSRSTSTLTDTSQSWTVNNLVGLGLSVGGQMFKIESNTATSITVAGNEIDKIIGSTYEVKVYNPAIIIDGVYLTLYKSYLTEDNYQLDTRIVLQEYGKRMQHVVDDINNSTYFVASAPKYPDLFAWLLIRQKNITTITNEVVPPSRNFQLANKDIIRGSVVFSEKNIFANEVNEANVSMAYGNYYLDYISGRMLTNIFPSGKGTISYRYLKMPFSVVFSPIAIYNFKDDSTQDFLFQTIEMKYYKTFADRYIAGQPKSDMIEYVYELLNVSPLMWGK